MAAIDRAIEKLDAILAGLGAKAAAKPATSTAPSNSSSSASVATAAKPATAATTATAAAANAPAAGTSGQQQQAAPEARDILINKAQIKVARLLTVVPQPNSEKLLKMTADLGKGDTRQIMAGLQQFLKPEDLQGRVVCVVANLKPAKLAGEPSEAMVLAASCSSSSGGELVRPLVPPEGSQPGDLVHLDGTCAPDSYPKVLKLDDWRKVVPGLAVRQGKATFNGTALMAAAGVVTVAGDIVDGAEIH